MNSLQKWGLWKSRFRVETVTGNSSHTSGSPASEDGWASGVHCWGRVGVSIQQTQRDSGSLNSVRMISSSYLKKGENSLVCPQKVKDGVTMQFSDSTPRCLPKRNEIQVSKRHLFTHVHSE
jgi:hypothetical protein